MVVFGVVLITAPPVEMFSFRFEAKVVAELIETAAADWFPADVADVAVPEVRSATDAPSRLACSVIALEPTVPVYVASKVKSTPSDLVKVIALFATVAR